MNHIDCDKAQFEKHSSQTAETMHEVPTLDHIMTAEEDKQDQGVTDP